MHLAALHQRQVERENLRVPENLVDEEGDAN